MNTFKKYYLLSVAGTLVAAFYPLYMGFRVVRDMVRDGQVLAANYPKYIIPYTPISLAVIVAVLLMPLIIKYARRFALPAASVFGVGVFFLAELLLEKWVIVTSTVKTTLESWQMYMCYVPPQQYETRTWRALDILIGEYSPAFKLHFYAISVVLILSLINVIYGFGSMIKSQDRRRLKPLVLQAVSSALLLGLCILACFTAFFRDGEITVSAVSAVLMCVFFVVFGVTAGVYAASFLTDTGRISIVVPSAISMAMTTVMYIGEMILLSGHLYRFGSGFFFEGLGAIVLAPVDILVILLSGGVCSLLLMLILKVKSKAKYIIFGAAFICLVTGACLLINLEDANLSDAELLMMVDEIAENTKVSRLSGNAYDYINAKPDVYKKLIRGGQNTVDCFVRELRTAESFGLREYIMAAACSEITGIGKKEGEYDPETWWASAGEWLALYDGGTLKSGDDYLAYSYDAPPDPINPTIWLSQTDDTFRFVYSALSSYIAVGRYELTDTTLTLRTSDGLNIYVFSKDTDSNFVFDLSKSSKFPEYAYSAGAVPQSPIPDGAVFSLAVSD